VSGEGVNEIAGQISTADLTVTIADHSGPPLEKTPDQSDAVFVEYADAIVKLDSGETLETTVYGTYLKSDPGDTPGDSFTLLSTLDRHKPEAAGLAQRLSGKSLYLTAVTRIYDMGLTTAKIDPSLKAGIGAVEAGITDAPRLTPVPILETHYFEDQDSRRVASITGWMEGPVFARLY